MDSGSTPRVQTVKITVQNYLYRQRHEAQHPVAEVAGWPRGRYSPNENAHARLFLIGERIAGFPVPPPR